MGQVLLVDDERAIVEMLGEMTRSLGHTTITALSAEEGLERFKRTPTDLVISDVRMGATGGLELLSWIRELDPVVPIVLVTGDPDPVRAMDAIQKGASGYLPKPVRRADLELECSRLIRGREPVGGPEEESDDSRVIGNSPLMLQLWTKVAQLCEHPTPVLITGENGAGKEVVAKLLHTRSHRAREPWVAVNVAAINPNLAESEFFGHERGAFSGADARRLGVFEQAGRGTLFLDEIGELDLGLQAKLLRVIEDRTIRRVGGTEDIPVHARLITATNRDLEELVRARRFRADLLFRIRVLPLEVPPLRERLEDVEELAVYFLARAARESGHRRPTLTPGAIERLKAYHWPGNVRELYSEMRRAVQLRSAGQVRPEDLRIDPPPATEASPSPEVDPERAFVVAGTPSLDEVAELYVDHILALKAGNMTRASQILGVSRKTLQRRKRGKRLKDDP